MEIILIAFSGGRTSAYMTYWLLRVKYKAEWDNELKMHVGKDDKGRLVGLIVCFANTSREKLQTLEFVDRCDKHFGLHVNWLEGIWSEKFGTGVKSRLVDFQSAKKHGEVYEDMIRKHGIPNVKNPICTREMKTYVIRHFLRAQYKLTQKMYLTAIGFRVDEPKRYDTPKKRKKAEKERQIFPLADLHPTTKLQINGWWLLQPFNLELEEHQGNCDKCFKKAENKLIAITGCELKLGTYDPWWEDMEEKYGQYIPPTRAHNPKIKLPMTFYRGYKTAKEIREKAEIFFKDASTENEVEVYKHALLNNYQPEKSNDCEESCEPF